MHLGKLVFCIFSSLAELERKLIGERTKAGLEVLVSAAAKAIGNQCSAPGSIKKAAESLKDTYEGKGHSIRELIEQFWLSRRTLYKVGNGFYECPGYTTSGLSERITVP